MLNLKNKEIIQDYLDRFSSKESRKMRQSNINLFLTKINQKPIFKLNKQDIIKYFNYLNIDPNLTLKTKKNRFNVVRTFLLYCLEVYDSDFKMVFPKYSIKWSKIGHKESNSNGTLTPSQIEEILYYFKQRNYKHYLIFAIYCTSGCRKAELINMTINNTHPNKRYFKTTGKTAGKEYILDKRIIAPLKLYINERKQVKSKVNNLFITSRLTKYNNRSFNLILQKALENLGIERFSVQMFRKSLNNNRKKIGCSLEDREMLLGHSPSATNIKYYTDIELPDKIKLFDKYNPYLSISI